MQRVSAYTVEKALSAMSSAGAGFCSMWNVIAFSLPTDSLQQKGPSEPSNQSRQNVHSFR